MPEKIAIEEFLKLADTLPLIDVRSPAEYAQGHICGAFNIPLFTDEERAIVGTTFNHQGRETAILRGLKIVGPKLNKFYHQLKKFTDSKHILMYCWRGGMRSANMGWLFELFNIKVSLLERGYKAYRNHLLREFEKPLKLLVIGGMTGSGKTTLLRQLKNIGQQVIDLEEIASHRGSAFGHLGENPQPTTQQFENELFNKIRKIDYEKPVWIEDESRNIGKIIIPEAIWEKIRSAPLFELNVSLPERMENIIQEYSKFGIDELIKALGKIRDKLGNDRYQYILTLLKENKLNKAAELLLEYYDKRYMHGRNKRNPEKIIHIKGGSNNSDLLNSLIRQAEKIDNFAL